MKAVEVLMEHGVPEERIIFINLVRELIPDRIHVYTNKDVCMARR